jgi:hemerythrin superfamily protein
MNALDMLKADHERVAELFDQLEVTQDDAERRRIFVQIQQELELHTYIEESVFYPDFSEKEGFRDLIAGAYDEHQEMKDLIQVIEQTTDGTEWDHRVEELMICVEQHVADEEDELFPRIEKAFDTVQLMQLGARLDECRKSMPFAA